MTIKLWKYDDTKLWGSEICAFNETHRRTMNVAWSEIYIIAILFWCILWIQEMQDMTWATSPRKLPCYTTIWIVVEGASIPSLDAKVAAKYQSIRDESISVRVNYLQTTLPTQTSKDADMGLATYHSWPLSRLSVVLLVWTFLCNLRNFRPPITFSVQVH